MEALLKRMRAYRRSWSESMNKSDLNKDQLESLQRKPEIIAVVKELEDLLKQLATAEQDEFKLVADKEKERQQAEDEKLAQSQENMKMQSSNTLRESLRLLYALNTCLPKISTISIQLTENQFAALTHLSHALNGSLDGQRTPEEAVAYSEEVLNRYIDKSDAVFYQDVTYLELNSLVASLLSPPKAPKFGMLGNGSDFVSHYEEPSVKNVASVARPTIPLNMINFINPSEVL
ncbi:hypothetical protein BC829DRAFT_394154 [Chytridium lagenaria]|nr:hypothetical protein BC829DRAFT_394154 [Chytridium lagenaria]